MKHRNILLLLLISFMGSHLYGNCNVTDSSLLEATGKSTLAIHPLFVSQTPELVSGCRSDRNLLPEDGHGGVFQAVLLGSRTTNGDDLARYFFFDGQEKLSVAEVGPVEGQAGFGKQNLLAQNFNIFTVNKDFQSNITISPQQSIIGLGLHGRYSFWKNH